MAGELSRLTVLFSFGDLRGAYQDDEGQSCLSVLGVGCCSVGLLGLLWRREPSPGEKGWG